jgi:hypothetical protein
MNTLQPTTRPLDKALSPVYITVVQLYTTVYSDRFVMWRAGQRAIRCGTTSPPLQQTCGGAGPKSCSDAANGTDAAQDGPIVSLSHYAQLTSDLAETLLFTWLRRRGRADRCVSTSFFSCCTYSSMPYQVYDRTSGKAPIRARSTTRIGQPSQAIIQSTGRQNGPAGPQLLPALSSSAPEESGRAALRLFVF